MQNQKKFYANVTAKFFDKTCTITMPQKGEDQTKTGILIGKIAVEGGQGLTGEDEAGVLGQPGVQEGSLLRLRAELG